MINRTLKFVRLPLLLILIYAIARFILGVEHVPYAPRGNAMFSVLGLTLISAFYFGALSGRIGGMNWGNTILMAVIIALWAELLVFIATYISYAAGVTASSYYTHWDSLNIKPEDTLPPLATALKIRAGGFIGAPIIATVIACIGRLLGFLAPTEGMPRR